MIGSEKQVKWANQILDDALKACKDNMACFSETHRTEKGLYVAQPERIEVLKEVINTIENVRSTQSAAWIIENRYKYETKQIFYIIDKEVMRRKEIARRNGGI